MKRIFLLISAVAMLAACQRETPINGDSTVEIRLSTGAGMSGGARTRGVELAEDDINNVDVLVFKRDPLYPNDPSKAIFQYGRYAWHKGSSIYSVVLKEGTNVDLYFAINARATISAAESAGKLKEQTTTWAEARQALLLSGLIDRKNNGLPMWGHRYGENISTNSASNKFGTVKVLRAVATADVDFTAADNFILQQASIEFASDQGNLAFAVDPANITYADGITDFNINKPQHDYQLKTPVVPTGTDTDVQILYSLPTLNSLDPITYPEVDGRTSNKVEGEFYFYENDANGENDKNYTKVVVMGMWDQGTPEDPDDDVVSYYPLAFRERTVYNNPTNPNDPLNGTNLRAAIIRNHKYQFQITGVNGNGYETPDDAKNGTDMNMSYKVIEWAQWTDRDIIMMEGMWVSFSDSRNEGLSKTASLYRNAGSTDEIEITTNISLDKFKMTFPLPDGIVVTPESEGATQAEWNAQGVVAKIANNLYTVTLVRNGNPTVNSSGDTVYYGKYIFEARAPYAPSNTSQVRVVTDMIKFNLDILQRDATPDDWEDGGDTNVDLKH